MLLSWSLLLFECVLFFFFKQKTAYEMRISDWSSDVCSSDLAIGNANQPGVGISTRASVPPPSRACRLTVQPLACASCRTMARPRPLPGAREIGRASCRERVCQYV